LQYLSDLDEDLTVWDTELELDTDAGQVIRGRNLFKWIALTEGLDAALVADARVSARRQAVSTILETTPGLEG
jgi:ABC-type branched-subunit amino acid transport system ATPase component